jgi:hypothetical protein
MDTALVDRPTPTTPTHASDASTPNANSNIGDDDNHPTPHERPRWL